MCRAYIYLDLWVVRACCRSWSSRDIRSIPLFVSILIDRVVSRVSWLSRSCYRDHRAIARFTCFIVLVMFFSVSRVVPRVSYCISSVVVHVAYIHAMIAHASVWFYSSTVSSSWPVQVPYPVRVYWSDPPSWLGPRLMVLLTTRWRGAGDRDWSSDWIVFPGSDRGWALIRWWPGLIMPCIIVIFIVLLFRLRVVIVSHSWKC